MDYYLNQQNAINRLLTEWITYGRIIIAVDYDDTIYDFHNKGRSYSDVIEILREAKEQNAFIIINTGNQDEEMIKSYLKENNIPYDLINEQAPFVPFTQRKIYANLYLDDRGGLDSAYQILSNVIKLKLKG